MKIIVTGSSGFVGSHLLPLLRNEGHTVMGIGHSTLNNPDDDNFYPIDLLDASAVQQFDFSGADAVIHLAGLAAVGPSFSQPRRYIDANAGMQINLFEAMIAQKQTSRMLIVSSGSLYGIDKLPLTESSPIVASNPYAVSKITQEYLALYYQKRGFEVIIARPFNHIGPGQAEGFIAPDLAKQITEAEKAGQATISVGDLSSKRDFTDVRDIVKAYALLIRSGRSGEVYNVCSGNSHSGQEILNGLLKHSKCQINVEVDSRKVRPSEIDDFYGSPAKLTQHTGWSTGIPLEKTLGDVMRDWRERGLR